MKKYNFAKRNLFKFNTRLNCKRGQITLFIILGIIILFSVSFAIYLAQKPDFRVTPKDETPIETYVRICIESVGKDSVKLLSEQGGYINIPNEVKLNPRSHLKLFPGGEPIIPYWYYREQNRVPTKEFMQGEISEDVVFHIKSCLRDFEPFQQEYEITEKGNLSAITVIGDKSVTIRLNYPLIIRDRAQGKVLNIDAFIGEIQVGLGRVHSLAKDLMKSENEDMFFETQTMGLMTMNQEIPFTGLLFDCSPRTWRKSQLTKIIQDMLYWNIPQVRVKNTDYVAFEKDELYAKYHFLWEATNKKYNDLKTSFKYLPEWGMEMHVRPGDSEILRSNVGKGPQSYLRFLCMNTYHFTYDVEYPLLAMIRDDDSFNGEGLVFNFAFPVLIDHNEGNRADLPIVEFMSPALSYQFCSDVSPQIVDIRAKDFYTLSEIYHADIKYTCVIHTCELGQTIPESNSYRLTTNLPASCKGGILTASAPGYLDGQAYYDGSGRAEILMKPTQKFTIDFIKHRTDDFLKTDEVDERSETVSLRLTGPEGFETFLMYPDEIQVIELIAGNAKYDVELLMIEDEERITGGYMGIWDVKYGEMANKDKLTFKIAQVIPIPITIEEQAKAIEYLDENEDYQNSLRPVFR